MERLYLSGSIRSIINRSDQPVLSLLYHLLDFLFPLFEVIHSGVGDDLTSTKKSNNSRFPDFCPRPYYLIIINLRVIYFYDNAHPGTPQKLGTNLDPDHLAIKDPDQVLLST